MQLLDPQRTFAAWQRAWTWVASKGVCSLCESKIAYRSFHCDHVIPHSKGGRTHVNNAQALCAECNLAKSNCMDYATFFPKLGKPRQWQLEFIEKFHDSLQEFATDQDRGFLLYATPGAGKTAAFLAVANMLSQIGLIDWVVVVVPAEPLLAQVAKEAKAMLGLELRHSAKGGPDHLYSGEVITIHSVKNRSNQSVTSRNGRVLVVIDEFHHKGDGNTWGQSIKDAYGQANFKLLCTGTPFRSDGDVLPWCKYKELGSGELELLPDFAYNYGQALADSMRLAPEQRIVRVAQFHLYDATRENPIDISIAGERYRHLLSDNLFLQYAEDPGKEFCEKLRRARFNAAIRPDFDLTRRMMKDAVECLLDIRRSHCHAAGLVVCKTKEQAEVAAGVLREYGEDPVIVYGDADGEASSKKIKAFRPHSSPHRWIVAVQQVSEGVDIKRLRVCVWLTNKKTHLIFLQILGRIIRWEHLVHKGQVLSPCHQTSHMFMPQEGSDSLDRDDPTDLVKYAKEIEQSVRLVIGEQKTCNTCGVLSPSFGCEGCVATPECPYFPDSPPPSPPPPLDCELLGAGGQAMDYILRGDTWDKWSLEDLQAKAEAMGIEVAQLILILGSMSTEDFSRAKETAAKGNNPNRDDKHTAEAVGIPVDDYADMTLDERMEKLRSKIKKKVSRLGTLKAQIEGWDGDDPRRQTIFNEINKRWIKRSGKRSSEMSIGELRAKVEWLDQEIASLTRRASYAVV